MDWQADDDRFYITFLNGDFYFFGYLSKKRDITKREIRNLLRSINKFNVHTVAK